jgi:hypothetical protein
VKKTAKGIARARYLNSSLKNCLAFVIVTDTAT